MLDHFPGISGVFYGGCLGCDRYLAPVCITGSCKRQRSPWSVWGRGVPWKGWGLLPDSALLPPQNRSRMGWGSSWERSTTSIFPRAEFLCLAPWLQDSLRFSHAIRPTPPLWTASSQGNSAQSFLQGSRQLVQCVTMNYLKFSIYLFFVQVCVCVHV